MSTQIQRLFLGCLLLMSWATAYAYIDPGTGSALIQGVIAAVAAVGVTLKLYWHRIMDFVRRKKNSLPPDSDSDEQ